jgi:hypothetical protein
MAVLAVAAQQEVLVEAGTRQLLVHRKEILVVLVALNLAITVGVGVAVPLRLEVQEPLLLAATEEQEHRIQLQE